MKTMDAGKMAESFPTCLERVVSRRESFEIAKERIPCAYLVPAATRQSNERFRIATPVAYLVAIWVRSDQCGID
jgi:antitoxin (DNA-binding transcriptional repressor) of toxin-antitoxin stability system